MSAPATSPDIGRPSVAVRIVLRALRLYREAISPLRPACCRYSPTCSAYAVGAIEAHGLARGSWLALRRLLRCHPFHRGGFDPVPAPRAVGGSCEDAMLPPASEPGAVQDVRSTAGRRVDSVPA